MKQPTQYLTLLVCLIFSSASFGQEYTKKFFGKDFNQYRNAMVIIDPDHIGWTNMIFSTLESSLESLPNSPFPDDKYSFSTDPSKMPDGPYKVVEILDGQDNPKIGYGKVRMRLLVPDGSSFWFGYNPRYESAFPWLVGDVDIDEDAVCAKISKKVDEFDDKTTMRTPFVGANVTKIIEGDLSSTYLRLTSVGSSIVVGEKGVTLLLDDGSKLIYPNEEVDADVGDIGFDYSAFIRLNEEDLDKLSSSAIDKWRLYIFDNDFGESEAEMLRIQIGCIRTMN